jgi:tetratricopeptide (TPR) repeat protein
LAAENELSGGLSVADLALWTSIVLAPLAAGGGRLEVLPVLVVLASFAYISTLLAIKSEGRSLHCFLLPGGMFLVALLCVFQATPLPSAVVGFLSPRALEIRSFVQDGRPDAFMPITYEVSATLRDAARFSIYGMIALVAHQRARALRGSEPVIMAIVVAGVLSIAVGWFHRLLGIESMYGVFETLRPTEQLLSTFVNLNHASGFLMFATMCALGLALEDKAAERKAWFLAAALLCAMSSALSFSRAGLSVLILAIVVFTGYLIASKSVEHRPSARLLAIVLVLSLLVPLAAVVTHWSDFVHEFEGTDLATIQSGAKAAAMKDAWPMILDHRWVGIGRGSYISTYPAYKTSGFQFTFTHPENIAVELASDFGLVFGTIALVAFLVAVGVRLRRATSPSLIAALIGVAGLVIHNLVDFSLEMPGVAIAVAAILGGSAWSAIRTFRIAVGGWGKMLPVMVLPPVLAVAASVGAFAAGDLDRDLLTVEDAVADRIQIQKEEGGTTDDAVATKLDQIARRHPANPIIHSKLAFFHEIGKPPDLRLAIHEANKALFLAPTYAEEHLVVGRMLLNTGRRAQAFAEIRRGWAMADPERVPVFIRQVAIYAKNADEFRRAVPRRDEALDILDEGALAQGAMKLVAIGRRTWAQALLAPLDSDEAVASIAPKDLKVVAIAAREAEEDDLALRVLRQRIEKAPDDIYARTMLIEILGASKDTEAIDRELEAALAVHGIDRVPFLRGRISNALERGDIPLARKSLEELTSVTSPTQANQALLAELEATIDLRDNRVASALRALDRAIALVPSNTRLRMQRIGLFLRMGRTSEARADLQALLRLEPKNASAAALLERLPPVQANAGRSAD